MQNTALKQAGQEKSGVFIDWTPLALNHWQARFDRIQKTNLIQSYGYARAIRRAQQQSTRFGRIFCNGVEKGLVQIQEIRLLGVIHFVFLDRGPLWFEDVSAQEVEDFFVAFNQEFPKRFGRKRRVMPELPDTPANRDMMARAGFTRTADGYHSIWLDLTPSMEDIRARFKQKWRNVLNKSARSDVRISVDGMGGALPWLFKNYARDRWAKKYAGASIGLLKPLCEYALEDANLLHLRAIHKGTPVAAVLLFTHGTSATYQIGWINDLGKTLGAHNYLLFEAIGLLKKRAVNWLDLGGINEDSAAGVSKFKRGMGGAEFKLCGIYG